MSEFDFRCENESCSGTCVTYHTRIVDNSRVRTMRCSVCGNVSEKKWVVPLSFAPARPNRGIAGRRAIAMKRLDLK